MKEACYLNVVASKIGLSHVSVKKHIDLLIEKEYVHELNPKGKPIYLQLTDDGKKVLKDFKK